MIKCVFLLIIQTNGSRKDMVIINYVFLNSKYSSFFNRQFLNQNPTCNFVTGNPLTKIPLVFLQQAIRWLKSPMYFCYKQSLDWNPPCIFAAGKTLTKIPHVFLSQDITWLKSPVYFSYSNPLTKISRAFLQQAIPWLKKPPYIFLPQATP